MAPKRVGRARGAENPRELDGKAVKELLAFPAGKIPVQARRVGKAKTASAGSETKQPVEQHSIDDLLIRDYVRKLLGDKTLGMGHEAVRKCLIINQRLAQIEPRLKLTDPVHVAIVLAMEGYF